MIRIIHRGTTDSPDSLLNDVRSVRARAGIVEAEVYRTLAADDADHAIAILANDIASYADIIETLPALQSMHEFVLEATTEVYEQAKYELVDDVWVPEQGHDTRIIWPAQGPVSVVIQNAFLDNPELRSLTAQEIADTRREPGCLYYAWMENLELANHLLLLEVWEDQSIYDHHWFGRLETVDYRGTSGRTATTPKRGEMSREFYRQQEFDYHYGRLLPASISNYSQSIKWSAR